MPWVPLDDKFHSHRKIVDAGNEAVGLHVRILTWCGDNLTGGHVPTSIVQQFAGSRARRLAATLVRVALWEPDDTDGWRIHNWADYNGQSDQVRGTRKEISEVRRRAGRAGAQARWGRQPPNPNDGKPHSKPLASAWQTDSKLHSKAVANGMANGWQTDSPSPNPNPKSCPPPVLPVPEVDARDAEEEDQIPGQDLFGAVRAARSRAGLDTQRWHNRALNHALKLAAKTQPNRTRFELERALLSIAVWEDTDAPGRLPHVLDAALRAAANDHPPAPPPPPPWCGQCDQRTRLQDTSDGTVRRCPTCHPLREGQP